MLEPKIKERYRGDQGRKYHESKRGIPPVAYPWVARVRAEKICPYIQDKDTVLEYGVGLGWNMAELRCKRRIGFDVGEFLEPSVREHGIEFISSTQPVPDSSIDVVICHHVLEHVLEPSSVLLEIRRLLRPGGTLLLYVPYEKEKRYREYNPDEPNHHLYSWNVQTLGNLAVDVGFKLREGKVAMFSYDRFSAVWAVRLGWGERGYRIIRFLVHCLYPCLEVRIAATKPEN